MPNRFSVTSPMLTILTSLIFFQAKRARNNEAVKRSREKAREKANETTSKVNNLKNENEKLEEKVKLLSKELDFLKNIFLAHAGGTYQSFFLDIYILMIYSIYSC